MKSKRLYDLFHFRWVIPILSEIYDQGGVRFVTILNRLGISRSVLTFTLGKLLEDGLIIRNPGYGHPLRPEYLLTSKGRKMAPFCRDLMQCMGERKAGRIIQSRWALRIISLLANTGLRFSELREMLAPITPRALSEELKLLSSEGYVKRKVIDAYPPKTLYESALKSKPLLAVLEKHNHT